MTYTIFSLLNINFEILRLCIVIVILQYIDFYFVCVAWVALTFQMFSKLKMVYYHRA